MLAFAWTPGYLALTAMVSLCVTTHESTQLLVEENARLVVNHHTAEANQAEYANRATMATLIAVNLGNADGETSFEQDGLHIKKLKVPIPIEDGSHKVVCEKVVLAPSHRYAEKDAASGRCNLPQADLRARGAFGKAITNGLPKGYCSLHKAFSIANQVSKAAIVVKEMLNYRAAYTREKFRHRPSQSASRPSDPEITVDDAADAATLKAQLIVANRKLREKDEHIRKKQEYLELAKVEIEDIKKRQLEGPPPSPSPSENGIAGIVAFARGWTTGNSPGLSLSVQRHSPMVKHIMQAVEDSSLLVEADAGADGKATFEREFAQLETHLLRWEKDKVKAPTQLLDVECAKAMSQDTHVHAQQAKIAVAAAKRDWEEASKLELYSIAERFFVAISAWPDRGVTFLVAYEVIGADNKMVALISIWMIIMFMIWSVAMNAMRVWGTAVKWSKRLLKVVIILWQISQAVGCWQQGHHATCIIATAGPCALFLLVTKLHATKKEVPATGRSGTVNRSMIYGTMVIGVPGFLRALHYAGASMKWECIPAFPLTWTVPMCIVASLFLINNERMRGNDNDDDKTMPEKLGQVDMEKLSEEHGYFGWMYGVRDTGAKVLSGQFLGEFFRGDWRDGFFQSEEAEKQGGGGAPSSSSGAGSGHWTSADTKKPGAKNTGTKPPVAPTLSAEEIAALQKSAARGAKLVQERRKRIEREEREEAAAAKAAEEEKARKKEASVASSRARRGLS